MKESLKEPKIKECIFCKIIAKEIPADIIYEDDYVIAFLDINPIAKGHSLVVPKKHYEDLLNADDNVLRILLKKIKLIAKKLLEATEKNGFNLIQNNKKSAGQVIDHIHFHIIPRSEGDGVKLDWSSRYMYKEGEKEEIMKKMKKFFEKSKNQKQKKKQKGEAKNKKQKQKIIKK